MNLEDFRNFCLSLSCAKENSPWTEPQYQSLVTFTVANKWFCLLDMDKKSCNLKCLVESVTELQDKYQGVLPAWHMNKTHWITVLLDSDVPVEEIKILVKQAYDLIVASLSKSKREESGLS